MRISSVHNKKILALRKLYKSRERKAADVFIAEGVKEVSRGIASGFELKALYYCPEIFNRELKDLLANDSSEIEIFELDEKVYEKLAYRDKTEGILAVFNKKIYGLSDLEVNDDSLFIILESVEKPGNLGAVLRTADSVGASAIILTESKVDQYHPNVIRASIGAAFTVPVVISSNEEVRKWFLNNKIDYYSAALPSYKNLYELNLSKKVALVFGTESQGLSLFWLDNNDKVFTIPMTGIVDSLNVSVSVAVSVYEAKRQRSKFFDIG